MGFRCGLVGLPNVGKSTLFNALTRSSVPAANYPFCTTQPHVGIVPVQDPRLKVLAPLIPGGEIAPTTLEVVDLAGLVQGAHRGEGLGNQFLGKIAEVEAIAHVIRCFEDPNVVHVNGSVDPRRDIEIINTELALRDLGIVTGALPRLEKQAKSGDKKAAAVAEGFRRVAEVLNQGRPARAVTATLEPEVWGAVKSLNLVTVKPLLYVANIGESDLANSKNSFQNLRRAGLNLPDEQGYETGSESQALRAVRELAQADGIPVVAICGAIEAQIATLETEEERSEYRAAEGLTEPALDQFLRVGYELLGLITFFTIQPPAKAWTVRRGTKAPQAAGVIHSDFERGFIRTEVVGFDDFVACGSEQAVRERGRLRVEGKEYVVQDGDIIRFRFAV